MPTDWNEERKTQLRALWDEGISTRGIGQVFGISSGSVSRRARVIGCSPRPRLGTLEQVATLKKLAADGKSKKECAELLQRSYATVREWARKYDIQFVKSKPSFARANQTNLWPEEKRTRLINLWADGLRTNEIALLMRISRNAVIGKARRLGCPSRPSPIIRNESDPLRPNASRPKTGTPRNKNSRISLPNLTYAVGDRVVENDVQQKSTQCDRNIPVFLKPMPGPEPMFPASLEPYVTDAEPHLPEPDHEATIRAIVALLPPPLDIPAPKPPPKNNCRWIENDRRPWVFCTKERHGSRSYCWGHCEQAYQNWPKRLRAEAA